MAGPIEILPLEGLPEIRPGDDLGAMLEGAIRETAGGRDGDCVVVTSKVVSKAEGRLTSGVGRADAVAAETARTVARRGDLVIVETRHGFVCANAGVDASNVDLGVLSLLPEDPDGSAEHLRAALAAALDASVAVVITDTFGRAWREGVVSVAIGVAGMPAVLDLRGAPDDRGRPLEATVVALADEVAAASGLVMTKAAGIPACVVRGLPSAGAPAGSARDLVRAPADDLFRESPWEAVTAPLDELVGPYRVPRPVLEEAIGVAAEAAPDLRFEVATDPAGVRVLAATSAVPVASSTPAVIAVHGRDPTLAAGMAIERLRRALRARDVATSWSAAPAGTVGHDGIGLLACGRRW